MSVSTGGFFFDYVCPTLGGLIASTLCAAPIHDLRTALKRGTLGPLNSFPWTVMSGNCLGWCAYSYYTHDPFILAANLPGFLLSLWLNMGAAKLQYLAQVDASRSSLSNKDSHNKGPSFPSATTAVGRVVVDPTTITSTNNNYRSSSSNNNDGLVHSPQDVLLLRVLSLWGAVLVLVGWLDVPFLRGREAQTVGLVVNANLVFFYAAPLQTIRTVLREGRSDSLHRPTVLLNCLNATFWTLYGVARADPIVYGPNGAGLVLGVAQLVVLMAYPRQQEGGGRLEGTRGAGLRPRRLRPPGVIEFQPVHDADPGYTDDDDDDDQQPELAHPIPPTL
jgi:solute carrier family 50 protein (sugar transporter)